MSSRSEKDQEALDDAIVAIDAAINTLVVARMVVLRRLEDQRVEVPDKKPSPPEPEDQGCAHRDTFPIVTTAGTTEMCNDCGETVTPNV